VPNFETFTKRMTPLVKQPYVTIQKRGTISLNASAHAALGSPEAIELLYDAQEKIIGFRGVAKTAEHAYPVRAQAGKSVGPYIVSGTAFVRYYGIDTTVSRRFVGALEGNVLCIDLKLEGTVVTSNRSQEAAHGESPEGPD
jgi:hypothetical protein